jgi:serine/threonine-protein kinase
MQPLPAGERFGNYELTGLIGTGGMGAVYRAVHPEIGRVVAIKVLKPELARDDAAVGRFFDEARAVNAIRHDGIVDIFDLGRRADGTAYYVMEYLAGEDLAHLLRRESRVHAPRAVALVRQVCDALAAAHRRGIIHRDLKPQNLFVIERAGETRVKILDFGIAKLMHTVPSRPQTSTGVVLGTVHYMSPEQAQGEAVDERADLYSVGCILYQLVTGAVPYGGANVMQVLAQLVTKTLEPPSQRGADLALPPAFDAVVMRALAKDREARFESAEELSAALAAVDLAAVPEPPRPIVSRPSLEPITADGDTVPQSPATPATPTPTPPPAPPLAITPAPPSPSSPHTPAPPKSSSRFDSSSLLRAEPRLLDHDSERRIVRVVLVAELLLWVLGLLLYWLPAGVTLIDRAVLGRWLLPYAITMAGMMAFTWGFGVTQHNPRGRWLVNRGLSLLSIALITTAVALTGALGSYDILYYPLLIIIDRLREGRSLARLTIVVSLLAFTTLAVLTHLELVPYAPLYPHLYDPVIVRDRGLVGLVVTVVAGTSYLSYLLVDHLAARVLRREAELREIGRGLARQSDDLRRFVEPGLADAIIRGDAASALGHQRRRVTVVRVDCVAIARAAEEIDPGEFAHLLNDFYARVADLAVAHGGTVDRFAGGEVSVLFGALRSDGASSDAHAGIAFAVAALPKVAEMARRCEVAGVEDPPRARAAVHTGFATVGSFGSPSRLEFTAVGPLVEASAALLAAGEPDTVSTTHATVVLLQERLAAQPIGERALPGARHAVKIYRVEKLS